MKKTLLTAFLLAVPLSINAEPLSFDFAEIGYTSTERDEIGGEFTGFEVAGSYQLNEDFYLLAEHVSTNDRGLDIQTSTLGAGYLYPITDPAILFTQLDLAHVVLDRDDAGKFSGIGFQANVGLRIGLTDAFEVEAAIKYINAGKVDETYGDYESTYLSIGGSYMLSDSFAIYADYEANSESKQHSMGMRYYF